MLKLCRWNISKAATLLEMNRVTLHHKIKKFDLKPED
ncbi:MAG: helix-turn-helix domain-containing protein [Syntrophobacteraceae bacterium]